MDSPSFDVTVSHINRLRANILSAKSVAHLDPFPGDTSGVSQPKTRKPRNGNDYQPQEDLIQDDTESGLPSVVQDSQDITTINERSADHLRLRSPDATKNLTAMSTQGDLANSTQLISQSFYEPFIRRGKSAHYENQNGHSTTQRTYEEGDCGHVDITSSFVARHDQPDPQDQPDDLADSEPVDFSQPQTQPKLTQFSESQRFKIPAADTPAIAGRKRSYNGDVIDTPAPVRNPLVRDGQVTPAGMLGLSQAFAATQAASSPISHGLPTGPRSDRPSPNIDLQTRAVAASSSSPLLRPISNFRRTATEPAERYVPMKLSQAERKRHELSQGRRSGNTADAFDSFNEVNSIIAREQRRQDRKGKAERELKSLSSPIIPPKEFLVSSPSNFPAETIPEILENEYTDSVLTDSSAADHDGMDNDGEDVVLGAGSEAETEQDEDELVHAGQSSPILEHNEENKENHLVLVPKTGPRRKVNPDRNSSQIDASPSLRHSAHGLDVPHAQDIQSSDPLRIMDSQPSQVGTRLTGSSKDLANTTSDVSDLVEPPLQTNGLTSSRRHKQHKIDKPGDTSTGIYCIAELSEVEETTSDHRSTDRNNTIPETSSEVRAGEFENNPTINATEAHSRQSLTVTVTDFETAPTHTDRIPTLESSQLSSPIRHAPPGRKRMRMLEINAEPSPRRSQSQLNFDPEAILQLDEDHIAAGFLQSSPSRAISMPEPNSTSDAIEQERNETSSRMSVEIVEHKGTAETRDRGSISHGAIHLSPEMSQEIVKPGRQKRTRQLTEAFRGRDQPAEIRSATRHSIFDIQLSPEQPKVFKLSERLPQTDPNAKKQKIRHVGTLHESRMVRRLRPARMQVDPTASTTVPDKSDVSKSSPTASHVEDGSISRDVSGDDIVAPQMVLAHYKGDPRGYYPAQLIGGAESSGYLVQWEGYDPVEVDAYGLKALDLRIGDTVKVLAAGFAKIPYIIRGFKDKAEDAYDGITDIRGYRKLVIVPKQRKSLPLNKAHNMRCEVSIASIYLDTNMWAQMKARNQDFRPTVSSVIASGVATPFEQISIPSTPSSKGRRPLVAVLPIPVPVTQGLFSNMSFAISYDDGTLKESIGNLIQANGGLVIHDSFHDLLEPLAIDLKAQYAGIGFTALLTDRHSRKEKYMQALALGLPCLSGKWIEACVKHKELIDWRAYLLPAGESAELDNATRSRVLPSVDVHNAKLSEMIESRPNIFGNAQVIVVVGRGKAEAKRAPYLFLIQALGATTIHKVTDLKAAKDLLDSDDDGDAHWVFVDDKDVKTMQTLIDDDDNNSAKRAKGRPKSKDADVINPVQCRVAGNELVVQSLILGKLYEP